MPFENVHMLVVRRIKFESTKVFKLYNCRLGKALNFRGWFNVSSRLPLSIINFLQKDLYFFCQLILSFDTLILAGIYFSFHFCYFMNSSIIANIVWWTVIRSLITVRIEKHSNIIPRINVISRPDCFTWTINSWKTKPIRVLPHNSFHTIYQMLFGIFVNIFYSKFGSILMKIGIENQFLIFAKIYTSDINFRFCCYFSYIVSLKAVYWLDAFENKPNQRVVCTFAILFETPTIFIFWILYITKELML